MQNMHGKNMSQDDFNNWWQKTDTNGDEYISMTEHNAQMEQMFRQADTDGDGKLSHDELRMAMQKMHDDHDMDGNDMEH
jgi:Ca2+-binding EF-hand superfamily protein